MRDQSKALQLADELDAVSENGADPDLIQHVADELRRLHDLLQQALADTRRLHELQELYQDKARRLETENEALRQSANRGGHLNAAFTVIDDLHAENEVLRAEAERLDWLMLSVSGKEFRRIGVEYSGNCGRAAIDAARSKT